MLRAIALAVMCGLAAGPAAAEVVTFSWNPVADSRVGVYVLAWGNHSVVDDGKYAVGNVVVQATDTTATTPDLAKQTWYFAVKACTTDQSLCSGWSNEVQVDMLGPIVPPDGLRLESLSFTFTN
jgi:hypothetical protein